MTTIKQKAFLESLGYDGEMPATTKEASDLIDKYAGKSKPLSSVGKTTLTSKEIENVKIQVRRLLEIRKIIEQESGLKGVESGQIFNLVMGQL
uniref:Uncharacterized protein n=1 Tax=Nitrosopumivirus cobalaminus TaxID=3158414 RepID=A0AAU7N498_9VIRU